LALLLPFSSGTPAQPDVCRAVASSSCPAGKCSKCCCSNRCDCAGSVKAYSSDTVACFAVFNSVSTLLSPLLQPQSSCQTMTRIACRGSKNTAVDDHHANLAVKCKSVDGNAACHALRVQWMHTRGSLTSCHTCGRGCAQSRGRGLTAMLQASWLHNTTLRQLRPTPG
jgi:hypothetical protein